MPSKEPPQRFPVSFYLVAMLFIMFDIEIVFLYPYAVSHGTLGAYGFWAIMVFSVVFFLSFVYEVAKGGLDWGPVEPGPAAHGDGVARAHHAHHHPAGRPRGPHEEPTERRRERAPERAGISVRPVADDGLEGLHHNFLTARLEDIVQWARSRSTWGVTFGLACCAIEMMGAGASHYDLARFGMEVFRASPRQADIMIVAGRVSQKMAPVLRQVYDQMMDPKWVISMGVCASSGGMFNNYAIVQGVDQVVPVDVYAPGCPPTPETLIHAISHLRQLIATGEIAAAAVRRPVPVPRSTWTPSRPRTGSPSPSARRSR